MDNATCHSLIDRLDRAATVQDIHEVCTEICQDSGFDYFIYGARLPTSFTKPSYIFVSGYPMEWWSRYVAEGYIRVDPTVAHCATHLTPVSWGPLTAALPPDDEARRVMQEAGEFGLTNGVSFPVHGAHGEFAMFCLAGADPSAGAEQNLCNVLPAGHLLTANLHEAVRRVFRHDAVPLARVSLTERERQCLLWAAEGKTTWETSQILRISQRTVVFHVQRAADKLGVVNRQHAVARAVSLGLIRPQFG